MRKSDKTVQEQEAIKAEYLLGDRPIVNWEPDMGLTSGSSIIGYQDFKESK